MSVAILRQGDYLIASIQSDLSDSAGPGAPRRACGAGGANAAPAASSIDVAALDVIDSFVARSLRSIVLTARLRGAETVIVGIQPDVAIAMVQFRLNLGAAARGPRPGRGARPARSPDTEGRRGWPVRSASPSTRDADLVAARAEGRAMAERLGFPRPDPTLIATAISEVARNIVVHVGRGEIVLRPIQEADRYGLVGDRPRRRAGNPRRRGGAARRRTAAEAASGSGCPAHGA